MRSTLARLEATLGRCRRSDRPAAIARPPTSRPTLAALRPTLGDASALLARARPLLQTLRPTVTIAGAAGAHRRAAARRPAAARSTGSTKTILPYLARKDPETGKPTSAMIGGTAAGFGGSAAQQDSNGHFIRFPASIGTSSVYLLPCETSLIDPTVAQTLACDSLETALQRYLEYLPPLQPGIKR